MNILNNKFLYVGALALLFISVVFLSTTVFKLKNKVDSLSSGLGFAENKISSLKGVQDSFYSFDSKEGFDKAVSNVVSLMEFQKQKSELDKKYAKFSEAPLNVSGGTHLYGSPNARFSLIEFSDLECPYCNRFHEIPQKIVDMNPKNINFQWKNNPLSMHDPAAYTEALAAECVADQVGNRGFWVFVNDVFDQTRGNGGGLPSLDTVVEGVGADLDKFHACMKSNKFTVKVKADIQSAKSYGINSTPVTLAVDNKTGQMTKIMGAVSMGEIMGSLQSLLESESK